MSKEHLLQVNLPCWWHSPQQKLSCEYYLMLSRGSANHFWAYRWLNKLPKVGVIINENNLGHSEFAILKFGWVSQEFQLWKSQKISDLEISAVHRFIDLVALSNHPVCLPNQPLNTTFLLFLPLQCNVGNLDVCYNVLVVVSIFVWLSLLLLLSNVISST